VQKDQNKHGSGQISDPGSIKSWAPASWGLLSKFLLGMAAVLLVCCLAAAFVIYFHEKRQLEAQALARSELVMAGVDASRQYVVDELRPVMFDILGEDHFVREAMSSSYVGRAVMDRFAHDLPGIYYRRVAQNARNPEYEVTESELEMLEYFRANPEKKEWQGIVDVKGLAEFKRFKPVVFEQECLNCHGRPEDAPAEMVKMYGPEGGFGRSKDEIGGLVSVGIPVQAAMAQVRERAVSVFLVVFAALSLIFIALGLLFNRMVVSSLKGLLRDFQEATGETSRPGTQDELDRLGAGFNSIMQELNASRQRLQNWNQVLEDEIARVRQELESAQGQLIHSEKMAALGRMTANITHAIRNPLTAMGGFARRIEAIAEDEKQRKYAQIILKEMYRLEKLLREVVVFAQEKCCPGPFESRSLDKVLLKVLDRYQEPFKEQGVQVRADIPGDLPMVSMDEERVRVLLENLLDNALEAMPGGGEIRISAEQAVGKKGEELVRLSLTDTGPGIPREIMDVLFEPFSTTKDKSHGSGLGLPLSRKIMEEHGGGIEVENISGAGAGFHLYFPVIKP